MRKVRGCGKKWGGGTIVKVVFVEEAAGNVAYAAGYMNERTCGQKPRQTTRNAQKRQTSQDIHATN